MVKVTNELWTDAELASAVDVYVFLLRAESIGLNVPKDAGARLLLSGPLESRNEGSVRYRMRNISAVVKEMGGPIVSYYSPAEQVGLNVRQRLRTMLASNAQLLAIIQGHTVSALPLGAEDRAEVLRRLAELRRQISELERGLIGIGHNRPPEPLSSEGLDRLDFEHAQEDVSLLERQVELSQPNVEAVVEHSNRLLAFGAKMARWAGERATKFTDVTLTLLAPVLVAKATGLAPVILDAIASVVRAIRF